MATGPVIEPIIDPPEYSTTLLIAQGGEGWHGISWNPYESL